MARPFKQGLQYFPMDVNIFEDEKILELNDQCGPFGELVFIRLLAMIYANGYYLEASIEALAKRLQRAMGPSWVKFEKVSGIIRVCLELGLFDKTLSEQAVITSIPIQKQFILSTRRRRNVNIDKYWLLDLETMAKLKVLLNTSANSVIDYNNGVMVDNNPVNDDKSTQKEKENKTDKQDKYDKRENAPSMHYLTNCLMEEGYISKYCLDYSKYNSLFRELVFSFGYEKVRSVTQYVCKYAKDTKVPIDDRYDFFRASAVKNLEILKAKEVRGHVSWEDELKRLFSKLDNRD